jgi:DNA mismatch repair protein MutL
MSKVQILPSDVIARIAAGEVVERPASVVKELMENSLDAGATSVEVHLKEGGKSLIHIKDNGRGITREDLDVLFQRHATSKITSSEDLEQVLSLGFRGEALYSIGSVAEVNVKSLAAGAKDAWEIDVNGGVKTPARPAAMASQGTEIRVKELFFNTPARKKFLKSDASEVEQVMNVFLPYVLLYPERHFILTHNGRTLVDLVPAVSRAARMSEALNLEVRHLLATEAAHHEEGFSLSLVLGDINIQRPRRDLQYLFVNGRPVQSRTVLFHVNDVYRLVMPDGVHPAFAVFLDIPPADVDVNIHPAKREVRIRQEARLGGFLRAQVEQLLMTRGGAKEIPARAPLFPFPSDVPVSEGLPADKVVFAPGQSSEIPDYRPMKVASSMPLSRPQTEEPVFSEFAAHFDQQRENSLKSRLLRARFIGTFNNKYHLFEEGESLFAVDQHAAQERILFEKFRRQVASGAVEVERFLTPLVVSLTPQERLVFDRLEEKLKTFGFEATVLDAGAVALHAAPSVLSDPAQAVRAILADDALAAPVVHVDHDVLARRACRASVMSGDRMKPEEAAHQLKHLMVCDDPFTCPHGRPVFVELKTSFFDRHFLRI